MKLDFLWKEDGKLPTYLGGDTLPAPLMQLKEHK